MNLLPKTSEEFRQKDYWDGFFKKRGEKAFEWYGEYGELCGILHKYARPKDDLLVVGCGNSNLSSDLHDVGYESIVSIDISDQAVERMRNKHSKERPALRFEVMDVTEMDAFGDESFSAVIDKGTLDAMMSEETEEVKANVDKMFSELDRVLRLGGRYVCISLLQPHILDHLLARFSQDRSWPVRVVRCREVDENRAPQDRKYPVFAFIATKFKKGPDGDFKVVELGLSNEGKLTRLGSADDLKESVRGIQQYAAIRAGGEASNRLRGTGCGESEAVDPSLDLLDPATKAPRYSVYLADNDKAASATLEYAVFIVPQGREAEWLFGTSEGRLYLTQASNCKRLAVVHLHREQHYQTLDHVKNEMSGYVMEFAPLSLPPNSKVPFLTLGEDEVGSRKEKHKGRSEFSGEYVVEDVLIGGCSYRRLIFLSNPKLIQSEAKLKAVKGKRSKMVVDNTHLACNHHSAMIGSLGFLMHERWKASCLRCLIVGLGGGALPLFISSNFPKVSVQVVEIDPEIVRISKEFFGFATSEGRLEVVVGDGVKHIEELAATVSAPKFDAIMFDVDSKDAKVGMSCPPKAFVEKPFLLQVKQCLKSTGIFVLNVTCRSTELKAEVISNLKDVFGQGSMLSYKVPQEVNEILYCRNGCKGINTAGPTLTKAGKSGNKNPAISAFNLVNDHLQDKTFIDIGEAIGRINLVA